MQSIELDKCISTTLLSIYCFNDLNQYVELGKNCEFSPICSFFQFFLLLLIFSNSIELHGIPKWGWSIGAPWIRAVTELVMQNKKNKYKIKRIFFALVALICQYSSITQDKVNINLLVGTKYLKPSLNTFSEQIVNCG